MATMDMAKYVESGLDLLDGFRQFLAAKVSGRRM
jgi:hypothetical protein